MEKGATLSECEQYRYVLWRVWKPEMKRLVFVMLNPSTADAHLDDPTIRRCIRFAADNRYGGIVVLNLFAYRATDPSNLPRDTSAIGPWNNDFLKMLTRMPTDAGDIVFAWGTKGGLLKRDREVIEMFPGAKCLGRTVAGYPRHPLYVPADTSLSYYSLERSLLRMVEPNPNFWTDFNLQLIGA